MGAVSILLLSAALVLISSLPWVEEWFDGIDRAAIWHRRMAITGLVLLAAHIPLSSSPIHTRWGGPLGAIGAIGMIALALWAILPRWQSVVPRPLRGSIKLLKDAPVIRQVRSIFGGYDRWRQLHRLTGLFVAAGFFHGLLDGSPFPKSPVLRWSYVAIGGIGLAFYVYRELLARFFSSLHDYEVDTIGPAGAGLVEISLRPLGRAMSFVPGQFALVYIEAKDGWHRHPFTIASSPAEGTVRFTIKALGDYTSSLDQLLEPGMPAVIGGPHGRFDHAKGTGRPGLDRRRSRRRPVPELDASTLGLSASRRGGPLLRVHRRPGAVRRGAGCHRRSQRPRPRPPRRFCCRRPSER